jgi:CheY-like chemotaxis protein
VVLNEVEGATGSTRPRKVVLVVDDEALVRMLAVDLFEELGCEVIEAGGGAEALARLEERPDVSLMFTDCRMPGMSGPELAEEAAKRRPHLRIVLVTGYHNMQVPGFPMVWKPFDQRTIERVVDDQV